MIRDHISTQFCDERSDTLIFHAATFAKLDRNSQAKLRSIFTPGCMLDTRNMTQATLSKPYADIAERLKWHRNLMNMTQEEYSAQLQVKRSRYSKWEGGSDRLSLDGALILRAKYGLSLDFLFEGIDDALPMTLRKAWIDRS